MKKKTSLLRGMVFIAVLTAAVSFGTPALAADASGKQRIDLIMLTGEGKIAKPELPPVTYNHGGHLVVGDCASCHTPPAAEGGSWNWDLKGIPADGNLKDAYHATCVSCHEDYTARGEKSGPGIAECRSCHLQAPPVAALAKSERGTVEFDSASDLHDLHVSSGLIPADEEAGANCGSCHHTYDAEVKKLAPDYEPSESCTSCHGDTAVQNPENPESMIASWRDAAHQSCVSCHLETTAQQKRASATVKSGPLDCAGCHFEQPQQAK